MKYSKADFLKRAAATSLDTAILKPGLVTVIDVVKNEPTGEQKFGTHILSCETEDGRRNITMTAYSRFKVTNGKLFTGEEGDDEITLLEAFKVVSSTDRKDVTSGEVLFPSYAYKAFADMVDTEKPEIKFDYRTLIASGKKEDYNGPAIQDYVIETV